METQEESGAMVIERGSEIPKIMEIAWKVAKALPKNPRGILVRAETSANEFVERIVGAGTEDEGDSEVLLELASLAQTLLGWWQMEIAKNNGNSQLTITLLYA
jgi:hypothetical protein